MTLLMSERIYLSSQSKNGHISFPHTTPINSSSFEIH